VVIRCAPILLILLALAGCGSSGGPDREPPSGPPLVAPRPSASSTVRPRPVRAGTVCGKVTTVSGATARVVVARGRATCTEALRVLREYNDPATPAEGTAGLAVIDHWTCETRRTVTTCTLRANTIQARP
jgi:hypothetical protein